LSENDLDLAVADLFVHEAGGALTGLAVNPSSTTGSGLCIVFGSSRPAAPFLSTIW